MLQSGEPIIKTEAITESKVEVVPEPELPLIVSSEFKVGADGVTIASIRGTARLAGVSPEAISKMVKNVGVNLEGSKLATILTAKGFEGANLEGSKLAVTLTAKGFEGANLEGSKLAETLTQQGFKGDNLASEGIPDTAVALIVGHYAFDAGRYCNPIAKATYRAFAAIGIRAWVKQGLGVTDAPTPRQLPPIRDAIDYACAIERLPTVENPILRAIYVL